MTEVAADLEQWWNALRPANALLAATLPLVVYVFRNRAARLANAALSGALRRFGFEIPETIRSDANAAMAGLLVLLSISLSLSLLGLPLPIAVLLGKIVSSLTVFTVFWLMNSWTQALIAQSDRVGVPMESLQSTWIARVAQLLFLVLAVSLVLKIWGIEVGPMLTGVGIAGAAFALAAQDLTRNLIAGFSSAGEMRFREGDWIRTSSGYEGIVEKIDLRSTTLRQFDHGLCHVPNAELANSVLVNFSRRGARRILWTVSLTYDTPAQVVEEICRQIVSYIRSDDRFAPAEEANLFARAYQFEASSIDLLVECFVAANTREDELEARHQLLLAIKRIVEDQGAEFAFPTRVVHLADPDLDTDESKPSPHPASGSVED